MSTEVARPTSGRIAVLNGEAIIADAGDSDRAAKRFVEFFAAE
ncbi:MAG: hypothetical protein ACLQGP_26650 [Isosphaeraceae bacterium]